MGVIDDIRFYARRLTIRSTSIAIGFGTLLAIILYNIGFRNPTPSSFPGLRLDIKAIESSSRSLAKHSWEHGALAEALLELHNPELSVFGQTPFPADKVPFAPFRSVPALTYARGRIDLELSKKTGALANGEGSTADPASLGVASILLGQTDVEYLKAASRQAAYLLEEAPRMANAAISHRGGLKEAWVDFVFMVPPFLAYYGVVSNDFRYVTEALDQINLYSQMLESKSGLWKHVITEPKGGKNQDLGHWSVGNAWVLAGAARVLATVENWRPANESESLRSGREQLTATVTRILRALRSDSVLLDHGLVRNYIDEDDWWGETGGTALIAASIYRFAVLLSDHAELGYGEWADGLAESVVAQSHAFANPMNPRDRAHLTGGSSEGHSFLLMLYAAQRDYKTWKGRSKL